VPSRQLARKPAALDHVPGRALPLAGLTAWQSLADVAQVRPGQRVLIHAAGGGVGTSRCKIAKALGAHVVGTRARAARFRSWPRRRRGDRLQHHGFHQGDGDIDVVVRARRGRLRHPVHRGPASRRPVCSPPWRNEAALAARVEAAGRRFAGVTVEPDTSVSEKLAEPGRARKLRVHVSHAVPLAEAARPTSCSAPARPEKS